MAQTLATAWQASEEKPARGDAQPYCIVFLRELEFIRGWHVFFDALTIEPGRFVPELRPLRVYPNGLAARPFLVHNFAIMYVRCQVTDALLFCCCFTLSK